jgi:hypothetical protein
MEPPNSPGTVGLWLQVGKWSGGFGQSGDGHPTQIPRVIARLNAIPNQRVGRSFHGAVVFVMRILIPDPLGVLGSIQVYWFLKFHNHSLRPTFRLRVFLAWAHRRYG